MLSLQVQEASQWRSSVSTLRELCPGCLWGMGFPVDPPSMWGYRNSHSIRGGKSLLGVSCDRWGRETLSRSPSAGGSGDLRHCTTVFFPRPGASNQVSLARMRVLDNSAVLVPGPKALRSRQEPGELELCHLPHNTSPSPVSFTSSLSSGQYFLLSVGV